LWWLKSVDENLKSLPKQLRKYVSSLFGKEKRNTGLIQLDTDGVGLNKSRDIAEAFS
jgi:mRNA-degrading endonuclease RelE of RelBE toxin-antitoxin system